MKLDLRKDFDDIYAYVVKRVKAFDPRTNPGPGKGKSVASIELGYQCDQDGWVALVFDTRPRAEPDGQWNAYIEKTRFDRKHWQKALETLEAGTVDVVLPDGGKRRLTGETEFEDFVALFGDLLKAVLVKARSDGVFKSLPTAKTCHMGVEEMDGGYGWPNHEDRGKDDLV